MTIFLCSHSYLSRYELVTLEKHPIWIAGFCAPAASVVVSGWQRVPRGDCPSPERCSRSRTAARRCGQPSLALLETGKCKVPFFFLADCKWFLFFAPQNIRCGAQSAEKAAQTSVSVRVCVCACVCLHRQLQLEPPLEQPYWFLVHTAVTGLECRAGSGEKKAGGKKNNPSGFKPGINRRHIGVYVHTYSTYMPVSRDMPLSHLLKKTPTKPNNKNPWAEQSPHLTKQQSARVSGPVHAWIDIFSMMFLHGEAVRKMYFIKGLQDMPALNGSFSMQAVVCLGKMGGWVGVGWLEMQLGVCQTPCIESSRKLLCV